MQYSVILIQVLLSLPLSYAQQAADGLIIPFTSALPACASKCGPLYDVQGKCTPPNIANVDPSCFCSDDRLTAFNNEGTGGVSSVCGPTSCTATNDLQTLQNWYKNFCSTQATAPSTAAPTASSTGSAGNGGGQSQKSGNSTWLEAHKKWVIMIVIIFVGLVGIWVGAWYFRRRYLRKKEKEIEMRPPVAWGPHQMHAAASGYGDGVVEAGRGGHQKEARQATGAPANRSQKNNRGWLRKSNN